MGNLLTITAHAYNSANQEIFTGTTLQMLTGTDDQVLVSMVSSQNGATLQFLQISQISRPAQIAINSTAPVSFSFSGNTGETLTYQIAAAENGGTFSSTTGSLTLIGTSATVVLLYTAPSSTGIFTHSVTVSNAQGNSVQTTFTTNVALDFTDPEINVQFNPVVTALTYTRNDSNVTLTAYVSDTGPSSALTYNWNWVSSKYPACVDYGYSCTSMSFVDATTDPAVLQGYDGTETGTISFMVANGSGGSTTVSYKVHREQFPASVLGNITLLPQTVMGTGAPGSDCRSGAISGNIITLNINDSELGYYDISNHTTVNTHIATSQVSGGGSSIAIDGDIIAYIMPDPGFEGTIGWYSISDGMAHHYNGIWVDSDTDGHPYFGRGDNGPTRLVSNGRIAHVYEGKIRILDINGNSVINTRAIIADPRSLSFSGDRVAFVGTSGTLQYYDIATGQTTDTGQAIARDQQGNFNIQAFPTIDNGTIVFGSSSGYVAYYDIASKNTIMTPILLSSLMGNGSPSISNGIIAVGIDENAIMQDLNGDGVENEGVLVLYDIPTGRMISTGARVCCWGDISNGVIVYDEDTPDGCVQKYIILDDLAKQYFGR